MHADLEALLNLQEHDKAVIAIEAELAAFNPELAALDAELAQAQAELDGARKGAQDAELRRAELEGKIESYRVMQERRRQRLEWVRGAKEASTLMAELDLARTVRRAAEVERLVEEARTAQASRREAIAAGQAASAERLAEARRRRDQAAGGVRRPLLQQYERIRRGRAPLALYPLHAEACGHCYTAVPLHRRQDILNGQSVTTCEACGVIVYHAPD
ncbi:MAG: hypothetical protein HYY94_01645 [Gemmatimonadetes bacterium]|nr:hypothetical protein [Gemmatimonadota bacterium]